MNPGPESLDRKVLLPSEVVAKTSAKCLDSSPSGFYIREQDPSKWVIFIDGGGLCIDALDCRRRAATSHGSSKPWPETWDPEAVPFSSASSSVFHGFSQVFVPYCSGDLWLGMDHKPRLIVGDLQMSGHHILEAVVEHLVNTTSLRRSSQLVFAGQSAGGIGVLHHADWISSKLSSLSASPRVVVLSAAGMFFPSGWPVLWDEFRLGVEWPVDNFMAKWCHLIEGDFKSFFVITPSSLWAEVQNGTDREAGHNPPWKRGGNQEASSSRQRFPAYDSRPPADSNDRKLEPPERTVTRDSGDADGALVPSVQKALNGARKAESRVLRLQKEKDRAEKQWQDYVRDSRLAYARERERHTKALAHFEKEITEALEQQRTARVMLKHAAFQEALPAEAPSAMEVSDAGVEWEQMVAAWEQEQASMDGAVLRRALMEMEDAGSRGWWGQFWAVVQRIVAYGGDGGGYGIKWRAGARHMPSGIVDDDLDDDPAEDVLLGGLHDALFSFGICLVGQLSALFVSGMRLVALVSALVGVEPGPLRGPSSVAALWSRPVVEVLIPFFLTLLMGLLVSGPCIDCLDWGSVSESANFVRTFLPDASLGEPVPGPASSFPDPFDGDVGVFEPDKFYFLPAGPPGPPPCSSWDTSVLGVSVFAPHYEPTFFRLHVPANASLEEVLDKVTSPGCLPSETVDVVVPVSLQRYGDALSLLAFPSALSQLVPLHCAVLIDLSFVGGHFYASTVPCDLTLERLLMHIDRHMWYRIDAVDVWVNDSEIPASEGTLSVAPGTVFTVFSAIAIHGVRSSVHLRLGVPWEMQWLIYHRCICILIYSVISAIPFMPDLHLFSRGCCLSAMWPIPTPLSKDLCSRLGDWPLEHKCPSRATSPLRDAVQAAVNDAHVELLPDPLLRIGDVPPAPALGMQPAEEGDAGSDDEGGLMPITVLLFAPELTPEEIRLRLHTPCSVLRLAQLPDDGTYEVFPFLAFEPMPPEAQPHLLGIAACWFMDMAMGIVDADLVPSDATCHGWSLELTADGRVLHSELADWLDTFSPDGWQPQIEGAPIEDGLEFPPAWTPASTWITRQQQGLNTSRAHQLRRPAIEVDPRLGAAWRYVPATDAPVLVDDEPSDETASEVALWLPATVEEAIHGVQEAAALDMHIAVFVPEYVAELFDVQVDIPVSLDHLLVVLAEGRDPELSCAFPRLVPVPIQPALATVCFIALPAWEVVGVPVLFVCHVPPFRIFAQTVPGVLDVDGVLRLARVDPDLPVHIYVGDVPWAVPEGGRFGVRAGELVTIFPIAQPAIPPVGLNVLLNATDGWHPEPLLLSQSDSQAWIATDQASFHAVIPSSPSSPLKDVVAGMLHAPLDSFTLVSAFPAVRDHAHGGLPSRQVYGVSQGGPTAAVPYFLDLRRMLLPMSLDFAPFGRVCVASLCTRLQPICPDGFFIRVRGGYAQGDVANHYRDVFPGQVIIAEFLPRRPRRLPTPAEDDDAPGGADDWDASDDSDDDDEPDSPSHSSGPPASGPVADTGGTKYFTWAFVQPPPALLKCRPPPLLDAAIAWLGRRSASRDASSCLLAELLVFAKVQLGTETGSDLSCLWSRHVRGVRTEVANARGTVLRVEEDFKISSYVWAGDAPAAFALNQHVMTILGSEVLYKFGPDALPQGLDTHRERYDTPDGDFFDVDFTAAAGPAVGAITSERPVVILLHGLESNSRTPFCCRLARAFQSEGFDVAVLCFRSCSGEMNRTAGFYNVGFTDDLVQLCRELHTSPSRQIFLSGFSLGGNAICKLLGELGEDVASLGIKGAAVCSVPFMPEVCSAAMDDGMGRLYAWNFLKSLKPKAEAKAEILKARGEPVPYDLEKTLQAETIGDFDDACVAPLYGFKDKLDYYRTQGSMRFLKHVQVPLLAMNAKDDPLVDSTSLPTSEQVSEAVLLYFPEFGGHCAFISDDSTGDPRNYCPKLLASFLRHVYDSGEKLCHRPEYEGFDRALRDEVLMEKMFLSFNEGINDKLQFVQEDESETMEMLKKDLPLQYTWSVWEQVTSDGKVDANYSQRTQKVASFGTVQDFWRLWNHVPQPSTLLESKRIVREQHDGLHVIDALMIFRDSIRPEWEDPMNAKGGHFQFQLKPGAGPGQIDEYWNNLVLGIIGATIEPPNMITGVRLVDKLSGPRAAGVLRIEVWFTESDDKDAVGALRKNVETCPFWQNCAARGLCDKRYEFRDLRIHESPEGSPKGNFKPLGHPDFLDSWNGEVDVFTEPPDQKTFWKKYHKQRRPFIVKGAGHLSPAMNWTDQYIMDHFGSEVAKVEWRNEDRLTDYCGQDIKGETIHCPKDTIPYVESRTSIRNFIRKSREDPSWAKYIISQMPDDMGKAPRQSQDVPMRGEVVRSDRLG
ncbi:yheT [Symbiodinium sp. KB8]|nr:yheT [Symbiodinium sp. KB8]